MKSDYIVDKGLESALKGVIARRHNGARALLLNGPPGCGKTAFADFVSDSFGVELIAYQFHAWSDSDELFVGVDVVSAVAGDADNVRQPGVLALAAEASQKEPNKDEISAVVLLDEIDKSSEKAEALLLDWLQTGRVPIQPGKHIFTDLSRLIIVLTSNATRELSDALIRRVRRVRMRAMDISTMRDILTSKLPKSHAGLITIATKAAFEICQHEGNSTTIQEVEYFLDEIVSSADTENAVRSALAGWFPRTELGEELAYRNKNAAALWAEVKVVRNGRTD